MKIVFLHRANDPYTLERIKFLRAQNHDVYSISFSIGGIQAKIEGVTVIRLKNYFIDKVPFVHRFSHYSEFKKLLSQIKPDILHVVSALNLFYASSKCSNIKIIENQGSDVIDTPNKYKFLIPYYKYYYKRVDGIMQDSKIAYESGVKYGAIDNSEINKIIEIGIDFKIFNKAVPKGNIRKKYNLGERQIVFHSRGTEEIYNIDIVLKSLLKVREDFPDCIYIFTTTFERLRKELKSYIIENDLDKNLLFVGYQDRIEHLKYFYRDANVNISVPSSDSSPFSVYESMACMVPNIVTDLPWLTTNFVANKHLITCPVRDYENLADKIIGVLKGKYCVDLDSAYNIVFNRINLQKENIELALFYRYLLKCKENSKQNTFRMDYVDNDYR